MKKKILIGIGAIIVLALAWYLGSPLFIEVEMNEAMDTTAQTLAVGSFVDADSFHKASGTATALQTDSGLALHFSEFQVTNGPDLRVYLATDERASDFVDLGKLKATKGSVNYDIPEGTDLEKYDHVLIWCRAFSVLFGTAELS